MRVCKRLIVERGCSIARMRVQSLESEKEGEKIGVRDRMGVGQEERGNATQ